MALLGGAEGTGQFVADESGELFHLRLHLGHFVAHVEDHFDAGEIDAEFASECQDYFEAFEVLIGVEPGVALRARRLEQSNAFVEAQSLRMNFVKIGDDADHVARA